MEPPVAVEVSVADGAVILGAVAGAAAISFTPVTKRSWRNEPFPFDDATRGVASTRHAHIADGLVVTSMIVPLAAGGARDDDDRIPKAVVYFESLTIGLLFNTGAKYLVQRPRPFTYGPSAERSRSEDTYLSFFSGHAMASFTSAVAGSYLYAYGNPDVTARAILWGVEMTLASATATERVRAGKHFPSDVITGAAVGTAIGLLVPRAHMTNRSAVSLDAAEWSCIGGGLVIGSAASLLLPPLPNDVTISPTGVSGTW